MKKFKKKLLVKLSFVVIDLAILLYFSFYDIEVWVTTRIATSFSKWLLFETTLLAIFLYILYFILDIPQRFGVSFRKENTIFKPKPLYICKALSVFAFPILLAVIYHYYNNSYWFERNTFDDNVIGVLIADFREVSLKEYYAQKKYSNYLKEELPKSVFACNNKAPIEFISTTAFFTSEKEAIKYGDRINARFVIYGDVHKTQGYITIKPNVVGTHPFGWSIGEQEFTDFELYSNYIENWRLSGVLPSLDTLKMYINEHLTFASLVVAKQFGGNRQKFIQYCRCTLERKNYLPDLVRGIIAFDLGRLSFDNKQLDSALLWHKLALHYFYLDSLETEKKPWLLAYTTRNVAIEHYLLDHPDSGLFYAKKSIELMPENVLRWELFRRLIYQKETDYLLEKLSHLWKQEKDSTCGDYLLDVNATAGLQPDTAFLNEYETVFPGRYEKRRVRVFERK